MNDEVASQLDCTLCVLKLVIVLLKEEVTIGLHPGASRTGPRHFVYGPMGSTGATRPSASSLEQVEPQIVEKRSRPAKPASCVLDFSIAPKYRTEENYKRLLQIFRAIVTRDLVQLTHESMPGHTITKVVKPEFAERHAKLLEGNEQTCSAIAEGIKKIELLGAEISDFSYPQPQIPAEWMDEVITTEYACGWDIACDSSSTLYRELDAQGFIEKAMPAWYIEGCY